MFQYEMRHKGMRQRSKLMWLGSYVFRFVGDYGGGTVPAKVLQCGVGFQTALYCKSGWMSLVIVS